MDWRLLVRYLQEFHWDDAKFPKQRSIADNLALMANTVQKLDDEVRDLRGNARKRVSLVETPGIPPK